MNRVHSLAMAAYAAMVAVVAGVTAALGVFARGDGTFETVTSVRGITYEMATSGVYAYNSQQVVAEGVGWDVFTLLVATPAMLVATLFVARGSFRGRLFALGMFGYFLYQYLEYAMTWALGPLFPLFIVLFAASLAGVVWFATNVAREGVVGRFASGFPRRAFAALNIAMASLLTLMWTQRIAQALGGDLAGAAFYGETTMVVQALDLGLVVPTALFVAYLVLRRSEAGYAMAAAYGVTAVAMSSAIIAMLVSASIVAGEAQVPPIIIFGVFAFLSAIVLLRIYRGIEPNGDVGWRQMGHRDPRLAARPAHG